MATVTKTYDVFISNSASDAPLAAEIAKACRANGLEAASNTDLPPGVSLSDALWDALAESRAIIVILSASDPTAAMLVEIGAARAWNKPIFGVVTDPSSSRLPPVLRDIEIFTFSRIDEIVKSIKANDREFSESDRSTLIDLYAEMGLSVDQLILDPKPRERLIRRFEDRAGRRIPGERLLSELLRMRKQGRLEKRRPGPSTRLKPRIGSN